jgi:HoxN/HupN/NixA family high-affinity nickel-transporter
VSTFLLLRSRYPLGVLFGLGFDTATEVVLLFLAAGAAASAIPWYAVLSLPTLFAAGMTLFDTIDGTFMNFAYGWAFSQPVRKVGFYLEGSFEFELQLCHARANRGSLSPAILNWIDVC